MTTIATRAGSILFGLFLAACSSSEQLPQDPVDAGADPSDADGLVDSGSTPSDGGGSTDVGPRPDSSIVDQCNPVTQEGCTAPTAKCVVEPLSPGDGTECIEDSPNDKAFGDVCTGRDCVFGLACIRTSSVANQCQQVCDIFLGSGCESLGQDYDCTSRITETNWGVCQELSPICDPLTQSPCAQDEGCRPYLRRSGTWELRCRPAGTAMEGGTCSSTTTCERGLACVGTQGSFACKRYCDGDEDCTSPTTCIGSVTTPAFRYCDN